jgi:hypothetical protein
MGNQQLEWVSLLCWWLRNTNSINYLVKELFESGLQYVYHNLQQKIQIENLSTTNVTEQNSLIKANNLLFLPAKTKITG